MPIEKALALLIGLWRKADLRVAHNESFDARMIRIEMMRMLDHDAPIHDQWKATPAFCTQSKSTKIINLPPTEKMLAAGRRTPKSPNLGEASTLHRHRPGGCAQRRHRPGRLPDRVLRHQAPSRHGGMSCHVALVVTVTGMLVCLVIGGCAHYRLLEKMAGDDKEPK
ncbi:hypothetical protein [Cupriavidus basilensis]